MPRAGLAERPDSPGTLGHGIHVSIIWRGGLRASEPTFREIGSARLVRPVGGDRMAPILPCFMGRLSSDRVHPDSRDGNTDPPLSEMSNLYYGQRSSREKDLVSGKRPNHLSSLSSPLPSLSS